MRLDLGETRSSLPSDRLMELCRGLLTTMASFSDGVGGWGWVLFLRRRAQDLHLCPRPSKRPCSTTQDPRAAHQTHKFPWEWTAAPPPLCSGHSYRHGQVRPPLGPQGTDFKRNIGDSSISCEATVGPRLLGARFPWQGHGQAVPDPQGGSLDPQVTAGMHPVRRT